MPFAESKIYQNRRENKQNTDKPLVSRKRRVPKLTTRELQQTSHETTAHTAHTRKLMLVSTLLKVFFTVGLPVSLLASIDTTIRSQ
jgi:hypothetical protein